MGTVVKKNTARAILEAAGIRATGSRLSKATKDLDAIASALLTQQHARRRDKRGRQRSMMGAEIRRHLFGNLYGAWADLPTVHRLPGVTYQKARRRYTGPFVVYVQRFCGAVADHIWKETNGLRLGDIEDGFLSAPLASANRTPSFRPHRAEPSRRRAALHWRGLLHNLRSIEKHGVHVRDGIRDLNRSLKRAAKSPH